MKRVICVSFIVLLLALTAAPLAVSADQMTNAGHISTGLSEIRTADIGGEEALLSASAQDDGEVAEDGINTNVVTVWISVVSAAAGCAIIAVVIVLAKKNKNAK